MRIEQDQGAVSRAQYGPAWEQLPPSDYKLACHLSTGRSAFTFCVCPGGEVVAAASAPGQVVTNGMSYRARDGKNINGGFLVGVGPEDFSAFGSDPLAGVRFQEQWEHAAFQLGGGNFYAPAQRVEDFLLRQPSQGPGSIRPTYRPRGDLDGAGPVSAPGGGRHTAGGPAPDGPEAPGLCLSGRGCSPEWRPAPPRRCASSGTRPSSPPSGASTPAAKGPDTRAELCPLQWMVFGLPRLSPRDNRPLRRGPAAGGARDSAYKCFCGAKTLAETRLCRVEHFNRPRGSQRFVYKPLGIGAGYAGGIVSAAVDGIRVAEAIAKG